MLWMEVWQHVFFACSEWMSNLSIRFSFVEALQQRYLYIYISLFGPNDSGKNTLSALQQLFFFLSSFGRFNLLFAQRAPTQFTSTSGLPSVRFCEAPPRSKPSLFPITHAPCDSNFNRAQQPERASFLHNSPLTLKNLSFYLTYKKLQ